MTTQPEPTTSVLLLRGVNVNGVTVRSAPLQDTIAAIDGVLAARTLLASGNVVVDTSLTPDALHEAAERALSDRFGRPIALVVVSQHHLATLLANLPWRDDDPDEHVYLTFASNAHVLDTGHFDTGQDAGPAPVLRLTPGVLAWRCPKGASTTHPVARMLARPALRSSTTTRNLRTIQRLATLRP